MVASPNILNLSTCKRNCLGFRSIFSQCSAQQLIWPLCRLQLPNWWQFIADCLRNKQVSHLFCLKVLHKYNQVSLTRLKTFFFKFLYSGKQPNKEKKRLKAQAQIQQWPTQQNEGHCYWHYTFVISTTHVGFFVLFQNCPLNENTRK